jgi:dipeptidyl aminopeptidase/acylaminoacyl peptidase
LAAADDTAYALGPFEGRNALWSIDLADQSAPKLLFKHPLVDVGEPILQSDRRLLGVRYDVERPYVWYADPKLREVIDKLERRNLNQVHEIVDSSADLKTLVIRSSSDVDEGTYSLYNIDENRLQKLGAAYPELDPRSLGKMTNIIYKAADGTEIPGYLTVPSDVEKKNLPLIVMPHDGPVTRDSWKFSFLRTFLANRGYAVLQMNYRGSSGFGQAWQIDPQKDWSALIHSDIQDATRWAVSEGIADPKRICIVGWGFGGYEALLSAVRNGATYKCAVSIAGIADLSLQQEHAASLGLVELRKEIGAERERFKREAPLANAAQISIPVLLVHGTKDWQVQVDHTNAMEGELKGSKKTYTVVYIKGAGHDLERKSDRVTLLQNIEAFLAKNLGP